MKERNFKTDGAVAFYPCVQCGGGYAGKVYRWIDQFPYCSRTCIIKANKAPEPARKVFKREKTIPRMTGTVGRAKKKNEGEGLAGAI